MERHKIQLPINDYKDDDMNGDFISSCAYFIGQSAHPADGI